MIHNTKVPGVTHTKVPGIMPTSAKPAHAVHETADACRRPEPGAEGLPQGNAKSDA